MNVCYSDETVYITRIYLWLKYYGCDFKVVNKNTKIEFQSANINDNSFILALDGNKTELFATSYFIRQCTFNFLPDLNFTDSVKLREHLFAEIQCLTQFLNYSLQFVPGIGQIFGQNSNKLITLKAAEKFGLDIPATIVATERNYLVKFKKKYVNIITKAIQDNIRADINEATYVNYTEEVDEKFIDSLPDFFFPSLFQEKIEKIFELRIFFIDSQWFTMAIFSQNDNQTKVDFRKYNENQPNRNVPFILPDSVVQKLKSTMEYLNYKTGSIDMVYDKNGRYVFLELNPVGQFGMTSEPCNYYIDKIIAEKICSYEGIYPCEC